MALIDCGECGKSISDMASSCPNCGIDIQQVVQKPVQTKPTVGKSTNNGCGFIIFMIIVLLIVSAFMRSCANSYINSASLLHNVG